MDAQDFEFVELTVTVGPGHRVPLCPRDTEYQTAYHLLFLNSCTF
jgi:hypothetical protein